MSSVVSTKCWLTEILNKMEGLNLKKYSVANTTREEREERAAMAQAINSLGAEPVAPEDEVLFQRHIDGELEIEEVTQMLIDKYKKSP